MNRLTKIISIFLFVALVCTSLCACGGTEENSSAPQGDIAYKVNLKDYLGNAISSGMGVEFMQGETRVALQIANENGVAEKVLPAGDYTIVITGTDKAKEYVYSADGNLSATVQEITVKVAEKINWDSRVIVANGEEFDAYDVSVGCTYLNIKEDIRNYYIFTPSVSGNYQFSISDGENVQLGYYGAPHFIQGQSVAEVENNSFTISVNDSMIGAGEGGTNSFVLGVDSKGSKNCVLSIARIGDPIKSIEDEPWVVYETTAELSPYVLPEGYEIQEFDLGASTDTYNIVFNETDGFYHLNDENGPLVLVRLGEDSEFIACFYTMLDRSGVSKYFFDDNGDFVKRESYDKCLKEYFEYMDDEEGVYPLTEDLKYIIQQRGEYAGWWNIESNSYIFKDVKGNNLTDINNEIAWLLMCCYID